MPSTYSLLNWQDTLRSLKFFICLVLVFTYLGISPKGIIRKMQTDLYTRMLNVLFTTVEAGNHLSI